MNGFLREKIWQLFYDCDSVKVFDEDVDRFAEEAYHVLVEWMGPGGEEIFLDMFLMANQSLPVEMKVGKRWGVKSDLVHLRRSFLYVDVKDWYDQIGVKISDAGFLPYEGDPDDRNDQLFFRAASEAKDPFRKDILLEQRTTVIGFPGLDACLVMYPNENYREELMGELAQPWEVLPPPYGPYVPKRRP